MKTEKSAIKREKSEYAVQAVSNAIDILELLGDYEHELSISEMVSKLNLTKSNVSKLVSNLEQYGYVEHNRYTGNFRLGVKTFQISQAYINKLNLTDVAMFFMEELKNKLNESVYVGILRDGNVVYLNMLEADEAVKVLPRIGNVGPAYATAIGKVQLAYLNENEVLSYYKNGMHKYTPHTIDSINKLIEDLNIVRKQGYALDIEEYEAEVCCIAAPVIDFTGKVIAGISVSAPKVRMDVDRINYIAPILIKVAKRFSVKFGYNTD